MYLNANNLYRWALPQKFSIDGFEWKKICLNLMKI